MILYYAVGGGLGHLTRAWAVIHSLNLSEHITVASQHPQPDWLAPIPYLQAPSAKLNDRQGLRAWIISLLQKQSFEQIWLDVFPGGLFGEWLHLEDIPELPPMVLVARHLKWTAYQAQIPGPYPVFKQVLEVEVLSPDQKAALEHPATLWTPCPLNYPAPPIPSSILASMAALPRPHWLLVHSGPEEEIEVLYEQARDLARLEAVQPSLLLVAPQPTPLVGFDLQVQHFPAWPLFPLVDRIFTGCGFNSIQQTKAFREKHIAIPFARRWDDQFRRAAMLQGREKA